MVPFHPRIATCRGGHRGFPAESVRHSRRLALVIDTHLARSLVHSAHHAIADGFVFLPMPIGAFDEQGLDFVAQVLRDNTLFGRAHVDEFAGCFDVFLEASDFGFFILARRTHILNHLLQIHEMLMPLRVSHFIMLHNNHGESFTAGKVNDPFVPEKLILLWHDAVSIVRHAEAPVDIFSAAPHLPLTIREQIMVVAASDLIDLDFGGQDRW